MKFETWLGVRIPRTSTDSETQTEQIIHTVQNHDFLIGKMKIPPNHHTGCFYCWHTRQQ